jgi:thymidylate kinase
MLLIEGPTGSGKTTLINEWVALLAERNALAPEPESIDIFPATTPRLTTRVFTFTARRKETPAQVARRLIDERRGDQPQARSTAGLWEEAASSLGGLDVLIKILP